MKYLHIPNHKQSGKRYVIADIHGCSNTFRALVNRLNLTGNDVLFLLGDYIDRGPHSKDVIDYIIELKNKYMVYCLKGNHEEMYDESTLKDPYALRNESGSFHKKYQDFFDELYYYIDLHDAILVHAGINFKIPNPFDDSHCMLWIGHASMKTQNNTGKPIIKGHSKKPFGLIKEQISTRANVIYLDNGCYDKTKPYGNLCCLELGSYELIIQPNIDD